MMVCETQEQVAYENGGNLHNYVDGDSQVEAKGEVFDFELNFEVNKPNTETNYHYRYHYFRNPLCPLKNFLLDEFTFTYSSQVRKS